jgi:transposase-like protein
MSKMHSEEKRAAVLADLEQGLSVTEASNKHDVSQAVIYKWKKGKPKGLRKKRDKKAKFAITFDASKSLSKHRNIKEARLLLEEFRDLTPDIKKVSRRDLLALLALTELEQIP